MIIIRPTKNLIKEINTEVDSMGLSGEDEFFSWHANHFLLNKKKQVIFMNDKSRLSITISAIRSNQYKEIKNIFLTKLKDYLLAEELSKSLIDRYTSMEEGLHFANTNNRSVIGTITESIKIMNYMYHKKSIPDFLELNMDNNRIIYKPIGYSKPIDVFKEELKKHYV